MTERERDGWRVGVDVGGTWIRVLAADGRGRRRSHRAPAVERRGLEPALRRIWRRWRWRRADVLALVVASRGVWTGPERARLARHLRGLASQVHVISDAEAAYLGALGARPGVLLLGGTGSMALGRDERGRFRRSGGLGPLLGDEGSAFWIGREWLRTSTRPADFLLARRLLASPDPVARIGALAPAVLRHARAGSRRARAIVARAQDALADLVVTTAKRLGLRLPVSTSWHGGLLDQNGYRTGVWRAVRRRGLAVRPTGPTSTAVDAALEIAEARAAARSRTKGSLPESEVRRAHGAGRGGGPPRGTVASADHRSRIRRISWLP